jgi:hypothetical protein
MKQGQSPKWRAYTFEGICLKHSLIGNRFPALRGVGPEFEAWGAVIFMPDAARSGFESQAPGIS